MNNYYNGKIATGDISAEIRIAPMLSILRITPDYRVHSTAPMPNWFRRLWYWILLGWTWDRVK